MNENLIGFPFITNINIDIIDGIRNNINNRLYYTGKSTFINMVAGNRKGVEPRKIIYLNYTNDNSDSIYKFYDSSFRPISGIKEITVEYKNKFGSVKKITISWFCSNKVSLEETTPYFLTGGKSVYLEWGWDSSHSAILNGKLDDIRIGQIEYESWQKNTSSNGQFDCVAGIITNFEVVLNRDGSYDCITELTTPGFLMESISIDNVSKKLSNVQLAMANYKTYLQSGEYYKQIYEYLDKIKTGNGVDDDWFILANEDPTFKKDISNLYINNQKNYNSATEFETLFFKNATFLSWGFIEDIILGKNYNIFGTNGNVNYTFTTLNSKFQKHQMADYLRSSDLYVCMIPKYNVGTLNANDLKISLTKEEIEGYNKSKNGEFDEVKSDVSIEDKTKDFMEKYKEYYTNNQKRMFEYDGEIIVGGSEYLYVNKREYENDTFIREFKILKIANSSKTKKRYIAYLINYDTLFHHILQYGDKNQSISQFQLVFLHKMDYNFKESPVSIFGDVYTKISDISKLTSEIRRHYNAWKVKNSPESLHDFGGNPIFEVVLVVRYDNSLSKGSSGNSVTTVKGQKSLYGDRILPMIGAKKGLVYDQSTLFLKTYENISNIFYDDLGSNNLLVGIYTDNKIEFKNSKIDETTTKFDIYVYWGSVKSYKKTLDYNPTRFKLGQSFSKDDHINVFEYNSFTKKSELVRRIAFMFSYTKEDTLFESNVTNKETEILKTYRDEKLQELIDMNNDIQNLKNEQAKRDGKPPENVTDATPKEIWDDKFTDKNITNANNIPSNLSKFCENYNGEIRKILVNSEFFRKTILENENIFNGLTTILDGISEACGNYFGFIFTNNPLRVNDPGKTLNSNISTSWYVFDVNNRKVYDNVEDVVDEKTIYKFNLTDSNTENIEKSNEIFGTFATSFNMKTKVSNASAFSLYYNQHAKDIYSYGKGDENLYYSLYKNSENVTFVDDLGYANDIETDNDIPVTDVDLKVSPLESLENSMKSDEQGILRKHVKLDKSFDYLYKFLPLYGAGYNFKFQFINNDSGSFYLRGKDGMRIGLYNNLGINAGTNFISGLIPIEVDLELQGMSGFRIGDCFKINEVPDIYNNNGAFQITNVSNTVAVNNWTTKLTAGYRVISEMTSNGKIDAENAKVVPYKENVSTNYGVNSDDLPMVIFALLMSHEGGKGNPAIYGVHPKAFPNEYKKILDLHTAGKFSDAIKIAYTVANNEFWKKFVPSNITNNAVRYMILRTSYHIPAQYNGYTIPTNDANKFFMRLIDNYMPGGAVSSFDGNDSQRLRIINQLREIMGGKNDGYNKNTPLANSEFTDVLIKRALNRIRNSGEGLGELVRVVEK